jgi:2-methylisocitrate lyase-like PEP mutase family enzyme
MPTHDELYAAFRALHERPGAFIIPNPCDIGSARVLAAMGFEALATTSSGMAYGLGKRDGAATRDEVFEHLRALVANIDVPINADLGKRFWEHAGGCRGDVPTGRAVGRCWSVG